MSRFNIDHCPTNEGISRRQFLAGTSIIVLPVIAGCADVEERTLGDSVDVGGYIVTVDEYVTASELTEADRGDDTLTPSAGAIFLLVHLVFQNQSETQKELPRSTEIELFYNEEEAPQATVGFEKTVRGNGREFKVYRFTYRDVDAVFPGQQFSGWMVYKVPEAFDTANAVLEVEIETSEEDVIGKWRLAGES